MRILCATDFPMRPPGYRWIWDHLPEEQDQVDFVSLKAPNQFGVPGKLVGRWPAFFRLGLLAITQSSRKQYDLLLAWESKAGLPLALLRQLTSRHSPPLVILGFTLPPYATPFLALIRYSLRAVDHVTVLARSEVEVYQGLLGLPPSKMSLGSYGIYDMSDDARLPENPRVDSGPYLHASGRSWRDYGTLVQAVAGLDVPVVIHGCDHNFRSLPIPANVEIGDLVPKSQYHDLVRNCLFEVVPLGEALHPIGASQILHAMMMGKPVVATRTACSPEFVEQGVTGLLVDPGDVGAMRSAIIYLLENHDRIEEMGLAAREQYEARHSFDVFARRTYRLLHELYDAVE